jgi:hypothetical protein
MNPALLKLSLYCALLSFFYWFFIKPSLTIHSLTIFPEFNEGGPTAVYKLDPISHSPIQPAYFIVDEYGFPVFVDLYTNQTIGDYVQYTGYWTRAKAYRRIYLTGLMYGNKRLYDYVTNKNNAINASHPLWAKLWSNRRNSWWPRLVDQYEHLLDIRINK